MPGFEDHPIVGALWLDIGPPALQQFLRVLGEASDRVEARPLGTAVEATIVGQVPDVRVRVPDVQRIERGIRPDVIGTAEGEAVEPRRPPVLAILWPQRLVGVHVRAPPVREIRSDGGTSRGAWR